jgi:hypothetical protein
MENNIHNNIDKNGQKNLSEKNNNELENEKMNNINETNEETIICPRCSKEVMKSNIFCVFCGYRLDGRVTCPNCGKEPLFKPFCSFCGNPLKNPQNSIAYQTIRSYPSPEERRQKKLQQYNTFATVSGILLLLGSLVLIGLFALFVAIFIPGPNSQLEGSGELLGILLALLLIPTVVGLILGTTLLKHRPDNNAWKGFYQVFRIVMLSSAVALFVVLLISICSFTFYIPEKMIEGDLTFWFFASINLPIAISFRDLWIIELIIILLCIVLLISPQIYLFYKNQSKKQDTITEIDSTAISEQVSIKENAYQQSNKEKLFFPFEIDKEKMKKVEDKKGRLTGIFEKLKRNDLIKVQELFALAFFASIVFIIRYVFFSISGSEYYQLHEIEENDLIHYAVWASISEEISFRVILIGVPMIIIIFIRFMQQSNSTAPEKRIYKWWDIPRALRGKYKQIKVPELILLAISSILFGFAHWRFWTGGWPFWKVFEAGLSGLFIGYAFLKFGIEGSIFIHFSNNVISGLSVSSNGIEWISCFGNLLFFCIIGLGFMKTIDLGITGFLWYKTPKIPNDKHNQIP